MTMGIDLAVQRIEELYRLARTGAAGIDQVREQLGTVFRAGTPLEMFRDIACICLAAVEQTWEVFEAKDGTLSIAFTGGTV